MISQDNQNNSENIDGRDGFQVSIIIKAKDNSRQLQSMDRQFEETKSIVFTDCMLTMKADTIKNKKGANILQLDLKIDN